MIRRTLYAYAGNAKRLTAPVARKLPVSVYFGVNPLDRNQLRGENPMNPPLAREDDYYWVSRLSLHLITHTDIRASY